jgi:hypothetical protein
MIVATVVALLCAVLLMGCGAERPVARPSRPTSAPGTVTSSVTPEALTPTATPTNTPTPSPSPTPIRMRDDYELAELYSEEAKASVYRVPIDEYLDGYFITDVRTNNDFVAVTANVRDDGDIDYDTWKNDGVFITFHLGVPDIIKTCPLPGEMKSTPELLDDGQLVVQCEDGKIYEYDIDLQEIRIFSPESGSLIGVTEERHLWFLNEKTEKEKTISEYSFEGELLGSYEIGSIKPKRYLRRDGKYEIFICFRANYTERLAALNTETGEFRPVDGIHYETECYDDYIEYADDRTWYFGGYDQSGTIYSFPKEISGEYAEAVGNGRLTTARWDYDDDSYEYTVVYRAYDIENMSLLGELHSEEMRAYDYFGTSRLTKRGYVLLDVHDTADGAYHLILWDTSAGQAIPVEGGREIKATQDTLELRELTERFEREFGIRVYFEEFDLNGEVFSNYYLVPCKDTTRLRQLIDDMYEIIREYPEGFWTEIKAEGEMEKVRIFLCDGFERKGLSAIAEAAALTSTSGDDISMAYGAQYLYQFETTFVHESMHMMEVRIEQYCRENHLDFDNYWRNELNSSKYPYFDAYTDASGKDLQDNKGTYWADYKNAWFIDSYSRTTMHEDRARVLENLYSGSNYYFTSSKHLRAKAENLCAMIRAAFPSVGESPYPLRWEAYIGMLDPTEYIERYRIKDPDRTDE